MNEKTDVLARRTNMTKVMEKAENPLHIYSEYWMQGCGGRCPYLNRNRCKNEAMLPGKQKKNQERIGTKYGVYRI